MASQQSIHDLVAQIGGMLDVEAVMEFEQERAWMVAFDPGTRIDLEYEDESQRLMLTGNVAGVEQHLRAKAYEALLQYTFLWTEHGGVRAAIDPTQDVVVLMVEVSAIDL